MNILTNYEYILNHKHVQKSPEQIIEEFRLFCSKQRGCDGCIFENYCTVFTVAQMNKWLTSEYNGNEWLTADDLK